MASDLYWFYDVLVAGILIIAMYLGGKRGLMRTVVLILLTVLSIIVSWFAAEIAAPIIYDNFIKERVTAGVSNSAENIDPTTSTSEAISESDLGVEISDTEINRLLGSDGDFFANLTDELKKNGASEDSSEIQSQMQASVTYKMLLTLLDGLVTPETLAEILQSLQGTTDSITGVLDMFIAGDISGTAAVFEETVIAPVIKGIIRVAVFVILLLIIKLIVGPIPELFTGVNKIPIIGPVNAVCGGILGVAEGLVIVASIALLIRMTVYLNEGSLMFLNIETIEKTLIFKYFYNMDLTRFGKF